MLARNGTPREVVWEIEVMRRQGTTLFVGG